MSSVEPQPNVDRSPDRGELPNQLDVRRDGSTLQSGPFVSVVMPCLNEEETVGVCVRKVHDWLSRTCTSGEVVVVDNGSTDRSVELASAAGARVVFEPRRGYGSALRRGFAEARGDWIVMGDADDTYDFSDLSPLIEPLSEGYDMSVGNRLAGSIAAGAMPWTHRYIGTPAISLLLKVFAGLTIGDSQCGLRAMTRDALARLELRTDGMELASEMILKAARRGLRVADIPITYGERLGEAKLRTVRDGWRHLRFLLLASPNYLFTLPGGALTLLGLLILVLSAPTEVIEVAGRRWQPIFAGSIFVVVGVNALLLGFASRLYTTARGLTNPDPLLRFYRRYLGLEVLAGIGLVLALVGIALEVALAFGETLALNRVGLAAIAQALIILGANVVLAGALTGLLDAE